MDTAIVVIDLHGMRAQEAQARIDAALAKAGPGVYRIRLIHGYNSGTALQAMIRREFGYGLSPKVKKIVPGSNRGITELVLREY